MLLPSQAQIDAAMQRNFGYDPGVKWNILDIHPSAIPGVAEVLVSINKQPPVHVFVSPDSQNAIVGEIMPFGPDPFAPAREKLKAADGPSRGPQKPVIEMVEFSDLECPHCKVAQPILEKLAGDFPHVRYTFQQFPLPANLHPWAMKAAKYADCAAQQDKNAFWKYIDSIFENQGGIALATADDKLKELATATGLDANKVAACAASPEAEARVNKSVQLGSSLEVNQTPTIFINGRRVLGVGNIGFDQLKALVQFEIDHAGK
ncbi:MAG TPA: thioredoxin domain-containing protein [Terriglobales bacterium]|nr:thioredoxin domain-containing protein [Terriglobales bacterium]